MIIRFSNEDKLALDRAYNRVIKSGNFVNGEEQQNLEKEISEFINSPFVFGSGKWLRCTLCYFKTDFRSKFKCAASANAFPATVNAVLNAGHKVVFADIDYLSDGFKV